MLDNPSVSQCEPFSGATHRPESIQAAELAELVGEVVRGARQTEDDSALASNTASQVVMNVRMVSGMMGEMVRSISVILSRVADSEKAAERAIAQSAKTAEHVAKLSQAVGHIESITREIEKVAGYTNILSLNATIEAARAGEAGRGFAVVAKEVKDLNKQTREATEHIGDHVRSIREANAALVESVGAVTKDFEAIQVAVAGVTTAAQEYDSSLRTVSEYAGQAAESVDEISSILDRTSSAAHQIAEKFSHMQTTVTSGASIRKEGMQCH